MRRLHQQLAETDTKILIIYQKEPHAAQLAFKDIAQPKTIEERLALAKRMKDEFEMPMPVLVDTMEDQSRALFSDLPSPVFFIDKNGVVQHKLPWPDEKQIEESLVKLKWLSTTAK